MSPRPFNFVLAAGLAVFLALPSAAQEAGGIAIEDPYARASTPTSVSGAAFMTLTNRGDSDDRLVAARSPAAERVELHTHVQNAEGVMRMVEVEDGFAVPAGGSHALRRGGDHLMLLGLTGPLEQGDTVALTLVFERAGEVAVEIPVDLDRAPGGHGEHDGGGHGGHGDG